MKAKPLVGCGMWSEGCREDWRADARHPKHASPPVPTRGLAREKLRFRPLGYTIRTGLADGTGPHCRRHTLRLCVCLLPKPTLRRVQ